MPAYEKIVERLEIEQYTWLITGVAGFIGSNLLEALLKLNQNVVGLDNFSTGKRENLDEVKSLVTKDQWLRFEFIEEDIRNSDTCVKACKGVNFVLHNAALGSVPRSLIYPELTSEVNISGFVNILNAARKANVSNFVYASSSSVYGDDASISKKESVIGNPLSPYAVTKLVNEIYAKNFYSCYGFETTGLRYFNVFGRRQSSNGPYSAVIPKWVSTFLEMRSPSIYGDGQISRDFCYVENVVQANILACLSTRQRLRYEVLNIAVGKTTTLIDLFKILRDNLKISIPAIQNIEPLYKEHRIGDIQHSLADISLAQTSIGYSPKYTLREGVELMSKVWVDDMRKNILG